MHWGCLTHIHSYITAYSISRPFNRARNVFKNVFNEDRILIFTAKVLIESGSKIVAKADLMRSRWLTWMEWLGRRGGRVRVRAPGGPRQHRAS